MPAISRWMKACEGLKGYEESHALLTKMAPRFRKAIAKANEGVAKL